jgi:predicted alpha/beta-hydrolase family hydrolase
MTTDDFTPDLLLDGPPGGPPDGPDAAARTIVLAHGAGGAMDSPWMDAIAARLGDAGLRVVRFEFPYMQQRRLDGKRRPPNSPKKLEAAWHTVIDKIGPEGLLIGGKSMGGRIASMVADDAGVAGLVCLGYPFHPPGKPEKQRTAHLAALRTPALFCQGERDAFGARDEVEAYALSDAIQIEWMPDGDHSLKPRKKSGRSESDNLDLARDLIVAFAHSLG